MLLSIEHISQPYSGEYEEKYLILKIIGIHPIGLGSDVKKILPFGVVNSEVNILVLHSQNRKG